MKGAIFCQVKIIKHWNQSEHSITCGNQKWRGATPAFISTAKRIIELMIEALNLSIPLKDIAIAEKIKRTEAIAWAKKYLIEASTDG